jgi:hypothetical protein
VVGCAVLVATTGLARGASVVEYVGVRAGYVMGRGWTLGPEVGIGDALATGYPFTSKYSTALVLGAMAAADVSFGDSGRPVFRAHIGPELGVYHSCPVIVVPVAGGLSLSFESGYPVAVGWHGTLSVLFAALHLEPTYQKPPPSPTFLLGPAYRATGFPEAYTQNELALEARWVFLKGDPNGLGYCGGD